MLQNKTFLCQGLNSMSAFWFLILVYWNEKENKMATCYSFVSWIVFIRILFKSAVHFYSNSFCTFACILYNQPLQYFRENDVIFVSWKDKNGVAAVNLLEIYNTIQNGISSAPPTIDWGCIYKSSQCQFQELSIECIAKNMDCWLTYVRWRSWKNYMDMFRSV